MFLKFLLRHIDGMKIYENWARKQAVSLDQFCESLDSKIWKETLDFQNNFTEYGTKIIASCDVKLGGGGCFPFLYFICRLRRPLTVVETGVAAGWSSAAILTSLQINGSGKLYSTDLPYKNRPGADRAIGLLVDDKLKAEWHLDISGDRAGLPKISKVIDNIDVFHFDSDKSYQGRKFGYETVKNNLANDAIIIFDDIQDNFHFKELVEDNNLSYKIFEFQKKFFGVIFC